MPFLRGALLKPKLQQRVCGKPAGNIAIFLWLLRGPLVLVGFSSHGEAHKSREVQPGPYRPSVPAVCPPMPGFPSIYFDAAGCHAGRQGRAAGLRKVVGAFNFESFACARNSDWINLMLMKHFTNHRP
eukprot:1141511-Pelagomonas_calceolata.AAC.1